MEYQNIINLLGKIKKVSKNSPKYNSKIITNEHDKEMLKKIYISRRKA